MTTANPTNEAIVAPPVKEIKVFLEPRLSSMRAMINMFSEDPEHQAEEL
jgi:hypothetical protein